uniref:Uncharacterized protein n=1 Tax=Populus trichocarpa TaxID=3694 RepID=A0A2K1ZTE9_POPTR
MKNIPLSLRPWFQSLIKNHHHSSYKPPKNHHLSLVLHHPILNQKRKLISLDFEREIKLG